MPSVGTDASEFTLQGKRIAVKDGVCIFEDGTLAGTHLDMATALRETVKVTGLDVAEAARMASATPAAFLSLSDSHGALAPGRRADWVRSEEHTSELQELMRHSFAVFCMTINQHTNINRTSY